MYYSATTQVWFRWRAVALSTFPVSCSSSVTASFLVRTQSGIVLCSSVRCCITTRCARTCWVRKIVLHMRHLRNRCGFKMNCRWRHIFPAGCTMYGCIVYIVSIRFKQLGFGTERRQSTKTTNSFFSVSKINEVFIDGRQDCASGIADYMLCLSTIHH